MRRPLAALFGAIAMAMLVAFTPARAQASDKAPAKTILQERKRMTTVVQRKRLERRRSLAVRIAKRYRGVRYVWGGASPRGFDCSGLVVYVLRKLGIRLPHHAASQLGHGRHVDRRHLVKGDLVYFSGARHMGMYIGHGRFIHAPHTGSYVQISRMSGRSLYAARRVIQ